MGFAGGKPKVCKESMFVCTRNVNIPSNLPAFMDRKKNGKSIVHLLLRRNNNERKIRLNG